MVDEFAVFFRFGFDGFPFFVVFEGLPICFGGIAAGVLEDVDERVGFGWVVGGNPVGDAFHVVLSENFDGVIAEAGEESVELAVGGVVNAEFVDGVGGCGLRRGGVDESFG